MKTRIVKESIKSLTFSADRSGYISVKLGNLQLLNGFTTLEDARKAAERWIEENEGLQVEY